MEIEMMDTYEILKYPDKRLLIKAINVTEAEFGTQALRDVVDKMFDTMVRYKGVGLAATQVDIHKKIIVMDIDDNRYVIINPEIVDRSETQASNREGCLSVPQVYGDVTRPENVRVRYQDLKGNEHHIEADGLLSQCIQHEIDHLNGIVYVDRMKGLKKNMLLKKYEKIHKY
jgi:peptide deformylase